MAILCFSCWILYPFFFHYLGHAFLREWLLPLKLFSLEPFTWFRSFLGLPGCQVFPFYWDSNQTPVILLSLSCNCDCIAFHQSFLVMWQIEWKVFFGRFSPKIGIQALEVDIIGDSKMKMVANHNFFFSYESLLHLLSMHSMIYN